MINLKVDLIKGNILKGNILKGLVIFAIPIFISNIFQQLYNTVDTMIVGNYLGDASLAAIGSSSAVYDLLVGFALGIGSGLSIVTARCYGSNDEEQLKKSVAGSLVIGLIVTVVITVVAQLFLYPLLQLLNTPENIIDESYSYILMVTSFVGVMFAYNLLSGFLRAIGNSFMPLVFLILSSGVNVILDIVLITEFGMGIEGAAIATVISQGISAVLCLLYIFKKCPSLIPSRKHFAFDKELYKDLLGQGFSMGFMLSIVSAGTVILQFAINNLGYLIIAGHTAARKLSSFCSMPAATLAVALSTFVSQNKGANKPDRIRKAVKYSNIVAVALGGTMAIILFFTAPMAVEILSGSSEAVVIENGARYLMINAPFYAVLGILLNLRLSLQGLGKKVVPLVSSIIELVGKIIFVVLLIPTLEYFGVIICEPVIWCFMCAQLAYSFYRTPYIKEHKNKDVLIDNVI